MEELMVPLLRAAARLLAALLLQVSIATAQAPPKEIRLTQSHIDSFVKIHTEKELGTLLWELLLVSRKADREMLAKLDSAVQKHGLKDYAEYVDVNHSISLVVSRIDPQTKNLIDREALITKQMADVSADTSISPPEKRQRLKDLDDALKGVAIREPTNIDLVMKNYDQVKPVF